MIVSSGDGLGWMEGILRPCLASAEGPGPGSGLHRAGRPGSATGKQDHLPVSALTLNLSLVVPKSQISFWAESSAPRLNPHPQTVPLSGSALSPLGLFWERGSGFPSACSCRVLCRLELVGLERVVRISAKPTKRLQEALQPILAKHGLSLDQVVLHRVSGVAVGQGTVRAAGKVLWSSPQAA